MSLQTSNWDGGRDGEISFKIFYSVCGSTSTETCLRSKVSDLRNNVFSYIDAVALFKSLSNLVFTFGVSILLVG